LECALNVRTKKYEQDDRGWREDGDKPAQANQQTERWVRHGRGQRLVNNHQSEGNREDDQKRKRH
jgi:hypothetical protein